MRKTDKWILSPKDQKPPPALPFRLSPPHIPLNNECKADWLEEIHNRCLLPFSCRRHSPGFAWRLLCSATPHAQRKDGSHAENEGCAPGKIIQGGTKGSPLQTGPWDWDTFTGACKATTLQAKRLYLSLKVA